ncbi:MAG: glycosyltransferase family 39 protein [Deltaproteobacteria bacterium]|nr:glycosyltransferase family 39 protein [Deltaproteobacteria bacterium]
MKMGLSGLVSNEKRVKYLLFIVVATAFLLRVVVGMSLYSGYLPFLGGCHAKGFWECGYVEYAELAINFAEGKGFHRVDEMLGELWSARAPLYPLILAGLYSIFGKNSIPPILLQSLIGTLTVLFTYFIAKEIFNKRVGILASILAAIYPYYVFHDTSLQDTAPFTFLTAVAIFLFLKSKKTGYLSHSFLAGIFLALAILLKVTPTAFLPFAILWLALVIENNRIKIILAMLLGFIVISAPWLIRNYHFHGKPSFVIHSGTHLWWGQNPYLLSGYPYEHIDRMTEKAWAAIPDKEKEEYRRLSEVERDNWFKQKAVQFMKENPLLVLKGAFLKIYAAFGWRFSPQGSDWVKNVSYTITYLPILLLGIIGAFLAIDKWRELSIIYSLFFTFTVISAVFFAHTSHRVYLDIYLMILSSYAIIKIRDSYFSNQFKRKG